MSRNRGKRYETSSKLNIKKVIATIIAIIVLIMFIVSLKNLLTKKDNTKDVSTLTTYIPVYENNKWGVIDNKENIVIDPTYDEMVIVPNKNKDLFICTYDIDYNNETYKTKVINSQNEEILKEYENIESFENTNNSTVWYENDILKYKKNNKYGLIDFSGKEILPAEYEKIEVLDGIEKSLIVEKNGKKGLFSTSSREIIITPNYEEISALSDTYESGYIVKNSENQCGIISIDKKNVLETKYDEIKKVTGNNYYAVVENGKLEIVDSTGNVVLNDGFDTIEEISSKNIVITKNGKFGAISNIGNAIIPCEYEYLKIISNGNYIAKKNGKYGIIDSENAVKYDFTYQNMNYIKVADFIEADNENFTTDIINANLEKVLEGIIVSELNIENGYLRIRNNNEYIYYNFKFEEKSNIEVLTTSTLFLFKEKGKYGYKNKNGEVIVDAIYDDAKEQNEFGFCAVKKDGMWGALKSDGTVVLKTSVNLDDYLYVDFIGKWHRYNDLSLYAYTK